MALSDYEENLDDQELNQEEADIFSGLANNIDMTVDDSLFDPSVTIIEDTEEEKKKKKKAEEKKAASGRKSFFQQSLESKATESFDKFAKKATKKRKEEAIGKKMLDEAIAAPSSVDFSEFGGPAAPISKRSIMWAKEDAKKLKEEQAALKETEEKQKYLDDTSDYRRKVALEELSFNNPYNVIYDIDRESAVETTNNLNKKINRLGLEATKFGDRVAIKKIGEEAGVGYKQDGTFFELDDVKGMNKFISDFGDKTYYNKVKSLSRKKYPDLWEKITPPTLSEEEKRTQATKSIIDSFENIESSSTAALASISGGAGGAAQVMSLVKKESFENPEDYYIYKQWKKNRNAPLQLEQSRIDAWDRDRKEKFVNRASTNYARNLDPKDRKNLQILMQEKINDSKYAEKALVQDIDNYKTKVKDFNTDAELYKKSPTPEGLAILKKRSLDLIDEQNDIVNKEGQLQKELDYTRGVLAPSLTSFSANYSRISQLANSTKSTLANVGMALNDLAAYGSAAVLGMSQEDVVKADATGLLHVSRELEKQKQQYQKSIGVDEIRSMDDAGNWLMGATVNTLPSIGMAFTGSAALPLFFASGYGGKATQIMLDAEAAKQRLSENTFALNSTTDGFEKAQLQQQIKADTDLLNLPEYKKFLGKAIYGGAEVGFEMLGTLKILKGVGTAARMLPKKNIKDALLWAGKNSAKNFNIEGLSELGTTTVDNFVDKYIFGENKNIFEGGLESYTQGGVAGVGFGGIDAYKVVKRAVASELADKKQSRRMKDIVNQISELTGVEGYKKDQSTPLPMQSPPVQKLIEELIGESQEIENSIVNRVGVDITLEQAKEIGDINRQIGEVNKDFSEAVADPNLSPSQLKTLENYYRGKFNELVGQRETLLTDPTIKENNIKANQDARFEFDLTNGYAMYDFKMQKLSYSKVANDFNSLNSNTKSELFNKAKTELELETEGNIEGITQKDIEKRAKNNYIEDHYTKLIKEGIKNATAFAEGKGVGMSIETFEGPDANERIIELYNKSNEPASKKKEFAEGIKNGTIDATNVEIGGKDVALIHIKNAARNGRTGVGSHEVLHSAVKKAFADGDKITQAGKDLLEYLEKYNPDLYALVSQRIDSSYTKQDKRGLRLRDENGDIIKDENYYEEAMNALSDISADGVELPKDSLNAIKNFINKLLPSGFPKFKEDQGAYVYEFVKNYNREAHFGKIKPQNIIAFSGEMIGGDDEKRRASALSVTKVKEVQSKIDKLESQFENDEIDYDDYTSRLDNLEIEMEKAKAAPEEAPKKEIKKEISDEDEVKEIVKSEKGSVASEKVQKLYDEKGVDAAQDIINLFKPITKRIVDKRRDAPGFDRDLLTDEIETGDGGILYLIKSYKPEKGIPLAAYINRQLPLRAIAASRRVLEGDFKKDVTEEKGLIAEETVSEAKEKPKYKNALESNVFESAVLKTMSDKIVTQLRTLKSRIDAPISLNRTITPLIAEIRDAIGKQLDIDVKKAMGGKKDNELVNWLLKNKRYMLENMTTTWLMGANGQGGIPQAIQKKIDGKWVSYPGWVDQKIDRESVSTDNAGRTSGAELVRRLPNAFNNVSDTEYLGQFVGPDGNPIRGRKESGAKAVAEESAFDIILKDLDEQGPIFDALTANQERLGVEVTNVFATEIAKQAERGNAKLSKTGVYAIDKESARFYNFYKDLDSKSKSDILQYLDTGENKYINGLNEDIKNNLLDILNTWKNKYIENFEKLKSKFYDKENEIFREEFNNINDFNKYLLKESEYLKASKAASLKLAPSGLDFSAKNISTINEIKSTVKKDLEDKLKNAKTKSEKTNIANSFLRTYRAIFTGGTVGKMFYTTNSELLNDLNTIKEFKDLGYKLKGKDKKASIVNSEGINPTFVYEQSASAGDVAAIITLKEDMLSKLRKSEAKTAFDDVLNFADWVKNSNMTEKAKAMAVIALGTSTYSPLRTMASVDSIILDENIKDPKDYVWEHVLPVDEMIRGILSYVLDLPIGAKPKLDYKALEELLGEAKISVIPRHVNSILNKILKDKMPSDWTVGDDIYKARYFNNKVLEYLRNEGIVLTSSDLVKLTGNKGLIKAVNFADKKANIQNGINIDAITKSLSKNSQTSKGISVFDFDDTVGLTKSNVLYTMPDGTEGKLNGAEFAKEGSRLLVEGAAFDFSEFSKVVDGKPGPMVEKMKKMIGKFGPENFFILTARPADSAVPIKEFLDSIGINIPLENITGLGNSAAQAKADWITAKAAEGYNDFYFTDDAPQNVKAVKNALNIPGVNSKIQQARAKFSLTSRQDLKWKQGDEDLSTKFTVGNIDYRISMIETAFMEYDDDVQQTLFDLVEKNNLDEDTTIAAYDGEAYNLEFWDKKQGNGITGTGNAAEVFGIVINGVIDRVKKKNIEALVFTAKEPSRIRLYNSMAEVVANNLGWGAYYKNGVYILSKKPKTIGAESGVGSLKPVKDALNVVDIKSPINQSRAKFSKSMSYDFNKILEDNTGTERFKVFSDIVARRRGVDKGKFDFYVPASAADFELLLYNFMGKGAKGEEHKKFFADALLKPYSNGNDLMDAARQSIKKNYKDLLNLFPDISKKLESLTPDGDFTYDQAIRVAIWNESDVEIPGISKRDIAKLTKLVNDDAQLRAFKDGLIVTGRQGKGWVTPEEYWDSNTIISDLHNLTEGAGRKKFLGEFIDNVEEIFGAWDNGRLTGPNMNKVEALYGTRVREALEDVLYRMTAGKNKSFTKDRETTMWSNWVNGSTGAIMFLNTRSAALQLLGAVNFLNFRDNNPVAAAMAFANQKQYWEDFARIWNSNKMKERRGGLKEDVAAAEIANAAAGSKNKANAVISYLLKIGYTPTQLADSFAIASGGAPFYRNRIKSYLKEGLSQEEAENKAWEDFTKVSDETQQSGDPRDISKQQASGAGRLLLTFQNFSMQQSRIVKKAILDLKNRRGDDKTNISKIIYYLSVQNILFSTLQQGLFAVFFDDDEEDKKKKTNQEKAIGIVDDVLDTILRGTGFVGGITVTLKNMIAKYVEESGKKQADYAEVVLEGASISPPIGSKLKKLYKGFEQTKYDKELIKERGWGVMQDGRVHLGPMYSVTGKIVEATTNIPMDRIVNKIENVSQAMNSQNKAWQRVMVGMGWTPYSVGIKGTPGDTRIEAEAKIRNKEESKLKAKIKRENVRDSIANLSDDEYKKYVLKKKAEREAKKDSIKNLPPEERKEYLGAKEKTKALKAREKEILKEAKADSVANLSPAEKAKYDKKVAEEKAAKKEERHQKYLEKKKALQDSLASLSPRERERYKAKKKAERHQYYLEHKDEYARRRKSTKKKKASLIDAI